MGAAENKQLLQQIFEELSKDNSEPFVASMADDFRWTVTGTTKWSRTYEEKQSVLAELFGSLRARINGRIRTTAHWLIAEGDYVVVGGPTFLRRPAIPTYLLQDGYPSQPVVTAHRRNTRNWPSKKIQKEPCS